MERSRCLCCVMTRCYEYDALLRMLANATFNVRTQFPGKERDAETGLDYFGARYLSSAQGRFTSPDPIGGRLANPQSLNKYAYVLNNPLKFIDPTGMVVEWHDSDETCNEDGTDCKTKGQRKYENRLAEMRESKDKKTREKGTRLSQDYQRLQDSSAIFEVVNNEDSGSSRGDISYQGNDHFTINLAGNDRFGLSDNQRLGHEFDHGRQILDGELSFHKSGNKWLPFAYDRTDEAKAFQAGFDIERASPGQGNFSTGIQSMLDFGGQQGIDAAVNYLYRNGNYQNLPKGPVNVPPGLPPTYYSPPR